MPFRFVAIVTFFLVAGCSTAPDIKDYSNKLTLPVALLQANSIVDERNVFDGLLDAGKKKRYENCLKSQPSVGRSAKRIKDCSSLAGAVSDVPIENVFGLLASADKKTVQQILLSAYAKSDKLCDAYMSEVITQSKTAKSSLGVSSLAFMVMGGVSGHAKTTNQLSNAAAFLTGAKDELSQSILGGEETRLHYRAVNVARAEERLIASKMFDEEDYAGLQLHLPNYHALCGISHGKNALEEAVSAAENKVEASKQPEKTLTLKEQLDKLKKDKEELDKKVKSFQEQVRQEQENFNAEFADIK